MSDRPNRPRPSLVENLSRGLWPDAGELIQVVVEESRGASAWRTGRAAMLVAAAPRVWMTQQQFTDWLTAQTLLAKRRKQEVKPMDAVGIKNSRKLSYLNGRKAVTKVDALAMAHYAAGRPMPIEAEDVEAFSAWFGENFGAGRQVADFLEVHQSYIQDRTRGFDIQDTKRVERLPDVALIRALDWIIGFGPFVPYGEPAGVRTFPLGEEE